MEDLPAAIELLIDSRPRPVGAGMVNRVLPYRKRRMVGPFIFADILGPDHLPAHAGVDVDAHPHLGLSTMTYLTSGSLRHRDSTGAVQVIEPGDVNWMTAGAGVTHTERSPEADRIGESELAGVQTWVALPEDAERGVPFFAHRSAQAAPVWDRPGVQVRVVAGSGWGQTADVPVSSPLVQADLTLSGGVLQLPPDHPERGVVSLSGDIRVAGRRLQPTQLAVLTPGETVEVTGVGRALLLGGDPVGKRFIWWNFVASDPEIIEAAKIDWDNQRFPLVPGDSEPWVPRPRD